MIDIHTHFIPNVDDGADSIEETLRLAEAAVEEGITHAILTPHHNRNWFANEKESVLKNTKIVERAINEAGIPLTVSPSQEIRMNEEFADELFAGNYLPLDKKGRYYLVEFSWRKYPSFAEDYLQRMLDSGMIPVIAHPERQRPFIERPELLEHLIAMGCIAQITTTSIIGGYSKEIQKTAFDMMDNNLIHVIASDAHNMTDRPFNMTLALDELTVRYGADYKNYLVENAEKILNSENISAY